MKQSINSDQFVDAFRNYGRTDNFSYEALHLLHDYFEELEEDTGEEIELDVIAICCEFTEDTIENIISDYNIDVIECEGDSDAIKELVKDFIQDSGGLIGETSVGLVYRGF